MSDPSFTRVLVPSGVLGLGFDETALADALALEPDIIAIDGGSTDSGPHFLGTGTSKYADSVIRGEWRTLLEARAAAGVPLVIGSVGTCGTDGQVDRMLALTEDLAAELGQHLRVATVRSEQSTTRLIEALDAGDLSALGESPELEAKTLASCSHIVALAGAEQVRAALDTGADVVIAGRATDTALIAALPIARGHDPGAAWHAAKIGECGALCSTHPTSGVVVLDIGADGFTVWPTATGARCTPRTVAAHMLYENSDPFVLLEPGGRLDVTDARYVALDDRRVRVTGSRWTTDARYTVKLEGAHIAGYRTMSLALVRDARYVANGRDWIARVESRLRDSIHRRLSLEADDYALDFRLIGMNAVLGPLETESSNAHEIGVLFLVTAATQALADEIARLADPLLLHCPLTDDEPLPTFAFPFSPAATPRGALHAFCLDHVWRLTDPMSAFRLAVHEVGAVVEGVPS